MNADERDAAQRLRAWTKDCTKIPSAVFQDDVRLVLDAVGRHERLSSEGLTKEEQQNIAIISDLGSCDGVNPGDKERGWKQARDVIAKLQAQLIELRDFRDIFIGNGWGDDVRAQTVEHETAAECVRLIGGCHRLPYAPEQGGRHCFDVAAESIKQDITDAIRRRFGLAAPTAEQPTRDAGGITPWDICRECRGTRLKRIRFGGPHDSSDRDYISCPVCSGTGRASAARAERRDRHIEERTP